MILDVFRIGFSVDGAIGGGGGAEMGRAGARSGGGRGIGGSEAEAGVGLLSGAGGLVEDGAVDDWDDDVGGGGGGAAGEGIELRLGEEAEIHNGN